MNIREHVVLLSGPAVHSLYCDFILIPKFWFAEFIEVNFPCYKVLSDYMYALAYLFFSTVSGFYSRYFKTFSLTFTVWSNTTN